MVEVDLMGPFNPLTMTGGKYVPTLRDTCATYGEVKILKSKSDAADALMITLARWETQTGKRVKILRSDNGGEFDSKQFADWIQSRGSGAITTFSPFPERSSGKIQPDSF